MTPCLALQFPEHFDSIMSIQVYDPQQLTADAEKLQLCRC